MVKFETEGSLICLPDRAGEYKFAFISILLFLSSVQNMQPLAFGVMQSFETYFEQVMDT
jgi:hypothetical protein